MPDEILRLGIDPTPAQKGSRDYRRATEEIQGASNRLAQTVEENARREAEIYRRAANERLQMERWVAANRKTETQRSAIETAEAFVQAQERIYLSSVARIKEAQVRGLLSPAEARTQGQIAAAEYNEAIVSQLDRMPGVRANDAAFNTLAGSIKNVGDAGRSSSVGMHRLNNSLVVLARQATGTHPIVGQLTDVVGTFAIGTAAMVPVLAGIAAIATGLSAITRESREAKRELGEARDRLAELGEQRRVAEAGGQTQVDVDRIEAEIARMHARIDELRAIAASRAVGDPGLFDDQIRALQILIQRRFEEIQPGVAQLGDEALEEKLRALGQLADAQSGRLLRQLDERAVAAAAERDLVRLTTAYEEQQRREAAETAIAASESVTDAIEQALARELEAEKRIAEHRKRLRDHDKEEELKRIRELERARDRALQRLARGMTEVGRAFGGTADQILSLTAAVLSLEELPLVSGRDRAVAYGTAALGGAGFGASTGNAALGAAGGAASGFITAGTTGAIVGGVSGIITGLMQQGERAQIAAAQWRVALRDFGDMFEDLTPTEQRQRQLDRAFANMVQRAAEAAGISTSVTTIEGARLGVQAFGNRDLGSGLNSFFDLLERLIVEYEKNQESLEENTDALDSITSALNAPSGFRQSYYAWLAQGVLGDDDGDRDSRTGSRRRGPLGPDERNGDIVWSVARLEVNVYGTGDARETATEVMRELERRAGRGNGNPLDVTLR